MDDPRIQRLRGFVAWTREHITGDEKGEAQLFVEHLFKAFGQGGVKEAGATFEHRVKGPGGRTKFVDCVWPGIVLIEMKKRGEDLQRHHRQALDYWVQIAPGRPRYVVLCNFDEFRIYDFDESPYDPMDTLALEELPDRYGPLAFLFPTREAPHFKVDRVKVTREAARLLATCFNKLKARQIKGGRERAQRFILQSLIALFSEDIGLLPKHFFIDLLDDCTDPPKAFDLLGGLFTAMSRPGGASGGRFKEVAYFDGGIFSEPAPVELHPDEVSQLKRAAEENWAHVDAEIFGTIFQQSMDKDERHALGAHFTSASDIRKIVKPTIIEPWRNLIENTTSLDELRRLQQRLHTYRVLDPACGSGNFLYIAYRELKRIEVELHERIRALSPRGGREQREFGVVTSKQFFGLDIIPFAVELAKVTMTLAHKLAIDELGIEERALPLDNLDENILCVDALISAPSPPGGEGRGEGPFASHLRTPWPKADVIIGNPPFLGAKRFKPERGADYVNAVRKVFPDVPGMADYCVYWLRRAHDHLPQCTKEDPVAGRAGLVGTQNIRNNKSRIGGLDHICTSGTIVEAVDNQPWSGESNVHVSIVNWVKHHPPKTKSGRLSIKDEHDLRLPPKRRLWSKTEYTEEMYDKAANGKGRRRTTVVGKRGLTRRDKSFELALREADHINSALSDQVDVSGASVLECNSNPQRCFQGVVPGYAGFVTTLAQRKEWVGRNRRLTRVVRPFLIGQDLLTAGRPLRAIIDFADMDLLKARAFAAPFRVVEETVLPAVRAKAKEVRHEAESGTTDMADARAQHLERWWQFWNVRQGMRRALEGLSRFICCSRVTKRPVFCFVHTDVLADNALQVFAFDDDYSFGVLQSDTHWQWFIAKCSKLKSDFRYTPGTVFDTFPWPQSPTAAQVDAVAKAGRQIRRVRDGALRDTPGGLRGLYRTLEWEGKNRLRDAHAALDAAVLAAYGFDAAREHLSQLLALNLQLGTHQKRGDGVTAPGVPPSYGDRANLISDDCISRLESTGAQPKRKGHLL